PVTFTITGTAQNGTDYVTIPGTVTIPAGSSSTTVTVSPIDDLIVEGNETVILTVTPASPATYTISGGGTATVTLVDNDGFTTPAPIVATGAVWKYLDNNSN